MHRSIDELLGRYIHRIQLDDNDVDVLVYIELYSVPKDNGFMDFEESNVIFRSDFCFLGSVHINYPIQYRDADLFLLLNELARNIKMNIASIYYGEM
jgi:hypothetical protein